MKENHIRKVRKSEKRKVKNIGKLNIFRRNIKISSFKLQDKIIAGHGQSTESKANRFDTTKHNKFYLLN